MFSISLHFFCNNTKSFSRLSSRSSQIIYRSVSSNTKANMSTNNHEFPIRYVLRNCRMGEETCRANAILARCLMSKARSLLSLVVVVELV